MKWLWGLLAITASSRLRSPVSAIAKADDGPDLRVAPVRTGVTGAVPVIAGSGDVTLLVDASSTADVVRLVRTIAW
jgi:hypothetical protein